MESREYEYKKIRTDQRIIKVETLPEATENSIDLFQYNEVLYRKKITISLANTTWLFNSEIDIDNIIPTTAPYETFIPLTITSNSTNYQAMFVTAGETIYGLYYYTSSNDTNTKVYNSETDTWVNDNYKTIIITGGNGVSNESIYNWLIENATLQSGSVIGYSYEPLQNKLTTTSVNDGTIEKNIGFDSNGNIVKAPSGGGGGASAYYHYFEEANE